MFFSAYLGHPEHESRWRDALHRHAAWLGLTAHPFACSLSDGRVFEYGWVSLRPPDTDALVREGGGNLTVIPLDTLTRAEALAQNTPRGFETTAIRMDVSLLSGEVRVAVPVLTVEQFYHANTGGDWVFGNDLRLMLRWAGLQLDERAIYSIFQFSFTPPPLTVSRTVRRIPPGSGFVLRPGQAAGAVERFFRASDLNLQRGTESAEELLQEALDGVLARVPAGAAMHFSGGLDSGLIAARLSAVGGRDTRLQNFSHGQGDIFRDVAPAMAAHLGMTCEQVEWLPSEIPGTLQDLARDYTFPFADSATIPTRMLIGAMDRWDEPPSMLLEGSGGGSLFDWGIRYDGWRRVYAVPLPLRRAAAALYRLGLWRSDARAVRPIAVLNASAQLPMLHAAAGSHATLNSLAYRVPPEVWEGLRGTLNERLTALSDGMEPRDQVTMLALLRNTLHMSTQRTFDAMRRRGIAALYPMLEPAVVQAGLAMTWDEKCPGGDLRAPLKRLMARSVPREWVYWPVRAFHFPFLDTFTQAAVRALVGDVVLSPRNPLMALCRRDGVEQVFRRAEAGRPMNHGAQRFVWALTSLSLWLSQLDS